MSSASRNDTGRRRLGRGLGGMIQAPKPQAQPDSEAGGQYISDAPAVAAGTPTDIAADKIQPNPHQPRRVFAEAELAELADSIRQQGILQPLIVTRGSNGDGEYILIAGERRLRAAKLAGLDAVPCILKDATEQQMVEWAVIENIQRSDLNPIERAEAFADCIRRFGLTQEQVAQRLGQPRATVANYLRLLDLNDELRGYVSAGQLSFGHAKVLAGLAGHEERQVRLARKTIGEALSVRALEAAAKEADAPKATDGTEGAPNTSGKANASGGKGAAAKPAYVVDMEQQLTETIGTKVTILPGRSKTSGRIVLEYYTLDDFDRISQLLGLTAED